jgi:dolichol-phosphate mannosyltransferase
MRRTSDRGRGRSGRDGFVEALRRGEDRDRDGRRLQPPAGARPDPPRAPRSLRPAARTRARARLGSRAVEGGSDADRRLLGAAITKAANLYIRVVLGLAIRDCNSGFRCWRREALERIRVEETFSAGPAIVQELLFKAARAGVGIAEVPIDFANRRHGESTLTFGKLLTGYTTVLQLRWLSLIGRI